MFYNNTLNDPFDIYDENFINIQPINQNSIVLPSTNPFSITQENFTAPRLHLILPLLPETRNIQQITPIIQTEKQKKKRVVLSNLDSDVLKSIYKIWNIINRSITNSAVNYTQLRDNFIPHVKDLRTVERLYKRILIMNTIPDIDTEFAWETVINLFAKGHIFKDKEGNSIHTIPANVKKLQQYVEEGIKFNSTFCSNLKRKIFGQKDSRVIDIEDDGLRNDIEIIDEKLTPQTPTRPINTQKNDGRIKEKIKQNDEVIDIEDSEESSHSDVEFNDSPLISPRPTTSILTPKVNKREREEELEPSKDSKKLSPISEHDDETEFAPSPESIVQENTPPQSIQNRELSPELIEKIIKLIKARLKVENDVSKINWGWAAEKFEQSAETIFFIWEKYLVDNNKWKKSDEPLLQLVNFSLEALEGKGIDWDWVSEGLKSETYQPTPQECHRIWQQIVFDKIKSTY